MSFENYEGVEDGKLSHYELSEQKCMYRTMRPDRIKVQPVAVDLPCPGCKHQGLICDGKVVAHMDCPQCQARFCARRVYEPYEPKE